MAIGLVRDHIFQSHDPGSFHCESPARLAAIDQALAAWPGLAGVQKIPLRAALEEELKRVHTGSHLARIKGADGRVAMLDPDTHTSPGSFKAALLAAGSLVDLCDAALSGDVDHGFAFVRPPGHHATPSRAMGFCLFNNVAVAAAHLVQKRGLKRVLIVDWDVHHGNGTEDTFYEEDRVFYFSIHQSPFYPGTGPISALGGGAAKGFNLNVPLGGGKDDLVYLRIFLDLLVPVARQFRPEFILVSAGFDCHREDPLGGMRLSDEGFAAMTRVLVDLSEEFCPGRVVATLEGGYNPEAEGRSVIKVLEALQADPGGDLAQRAQGIEEPNGLIRSRKAASCYWQV